MADYYSQFSALLELSTKENVARALEIAASKLNDDEDDEPAYNFGVEEYNDTAIWLHSDDDDNFDVQEVESFIKELCSAIKLEGKWGFEYSISCSKPRVDAFGGSAVVFDLTTGDLITYMSTYEWLRDNLQG